MKIFGMTVVKNEDDCSHRKAGCILLIIHIEGCNMERLISISGITGDMSQTCRNDFFTVIILGKPSVVGPNEMKSRAIILKNNVSIR